MPTNVISFGLFLTILDSTCSAGMKISPFSQFKLNKMSVSLYSTGPAMSASSVILCAALCTQYFNTCYSFIYNKSSGMCTPGSWVIPNKIPLNSSLGTLYFIPGSYCDNTVVNFTIRSNGSVSTCFWMSNSLLIYEDARKACQDLGANLYTIKVPQKLSILLDVVKSLSQEVWIGLDDLREEGLFRWVDDNTTLNINWTLFAPGQPNNYLEEHCVQYSPVYYPINDYFCSQSSRYICEIKPIIL